EVDQVRRVVAGQGRQETLLVETALAELDRDIGVLLTELVYPDLRDLIAGVVAESESEQVAADVRGLAVLNDIVVIVASSAAVIAAAGCCDKRYGEHVWQKFERSFDHGDSSRTALSPLDVRSTAGP